MANNGISYIGNNVNNYTTDEASQRAAANSMFAWLNPTSSYAPVASQQAMRYSDMLNSWNNLNNAAADNLIADTFSKNIGGWTKLGGLGLDITNSILGFLGQKKYYNIIKDQMAQSAAQYNETMNTAFKNQNQQKADLLSARAQFHTGNSHAYDDEIAANALQRGYTGSSGAATNDYITYKRSANA